MTVYPRSVVLIVSLCGLVLVRCTDPNSAQKAGEHIDRAVARAESNVNDAKETIATDSAQAKVSMTDAAITSKIKAAFFAESSIASFEINVSTVKEVVTLTGAVNSNKVRDKAAEIVNAISEVKHLNNQLRIE